MRLDKFLWFARIVKTRALAQAVIGEGRLRSNGRVVDKPAATVGVGDVLSFPLNGQVRVLRVLALPVRRGPAAEARGCYEEVDGGVSANVSQQPPDD